MEHILLIFKIDINKKTGQINNTSILKNTVELNSGFIIYS